MTKRAKSLVVVALMLVLALATLESTVVATAMPSIVGQLGGLTLYSWVFSAYLLTSTTTVPLYGKLADLYGRRVILFIGVGIFLLGSAACGSAQSMEQLIIFRAIQGLGAGAIMPLVLTIVADISTSPDELVKRQGTIGALWGVSSIIGPILGGLIVDSSSWRWVFYPNIPLGLIALAALMIFYKEKVVREKHKLDYAGTVLLTAAILALLLALLQGGSTWAWNSLPSIGLFLTTLVCAIAFWRVELKAAEPIMPLHLFKKRTITIAIIGGFLFGGMLFGLTTYVPLFIQGVQGKSATEAGLALIPNSLSWTAVSMGAAFILKRLGFRRMVQVGAFIIMLGVGMMLFFQEQTSFFFLGLSMVVIGVGFGLANIVYTMAVQQAAPPHLIGVATALTQFARLLGGTVGIAVMGSMLNAQIAQRFASIATNYPALADQMQKGDSPATILLTPESRTSFPPALLELLREAFGQSLFWVFLLMLIMAVVSLVFVFWFPSDRVATQDSAPAAQTERVRAHAK